MADTDPAQPRNQPFQPADIYVKLRDRALAFRLPKPTANPGEPHGILMETGYPQGVSTLVAMGEGSVSLYFSGGGGIIGGVGNERVREAGLALVYAAGSYVHLMQPAGDFPFPEADHVRFYVLTGQGVYTYEAAQDDLSYKRDPLSPLFFQGHHALTELRLVAEAADKKQEPERMAIEMQQGRSVD